LSKRNIMHLSTSVFFVAAVFAIAATVTFFVWRARFGSTFTPVETMLPTDVPGRFYPSLPGELRTIPEWISRDAPFDVVAAFAPVPAETNAAPLYLDALYEFCPAEMAVCVGPSERQARGPALKERHARAVYLQGLDQRTVPASERAAVSAEYEPALERLRLAQRRPDCVFEASPELEYSGSPHGMP
jgi:hypothetical protein